ncbi:site-specific integrase [Pediococcus acidilactici]
MASIEKRGNNWRVTTSFTKKGRRTRITKTFSSEKDAKIFSLQTELAKGTGRDLSMAEQTFPLFFKDWVENVKKNQVRTATYNNYVQVEKIVDRLFNNIKLQNLNDRVVQTKINEYGLTHARKTTTEMLLKIRASIRYAYSRGWLPNDFSSLIRTSGEDNDKRNRPLSISEFKKLRKFLLTHHETRFAVLTLLALETGCRRGELLGIKKENLHDNCVDIRRSISPTSNDTRLKTAKSKRSVSINKNVFEIVNSLAPNNSGFIFNSDNFHQSAHLKKLLLKLNIRPTTFHALRDSHASFLFSNDKISLEYISQRLGHSNVTTTQQYYLSLMPEKKHQLDADALNLLDDD